MDTERALQRARQFVELLEELHQTSVRVARRAGTVVLDDDYRAAKAAVDRRRGMIVQIAQRIDTRLAYSIRQGSDYGSEVSPAVELVGRLESQAELEEILGPEGPNLAAGQMHPWVWDHAAALWSDGYHRAAIQAAATALFDSHIATKAEQAPDTRGGKDLLGRAFSTKEPEPGIPRLRFPDLTPGTQEWTSAHEGAQHFGQGCAQSIRNRVTHNLSEPDEDEALEMLAALSYLARLVDRAEVVRAEDLTEQAG